MCGAERGGEGEFFGAGGGGVDGGVGGEGARELDAGLGDGGGGCVPED